MTLTTAGGHCPDASLNAFRDTARLLPGRLQVLDPVSVALEAGLPPAAIERSLLEWRDQGWLRHRPSGRDMLLELPPAPDDSSQRVADLLQILASVRKQRVADVSAYAETRRCRQGYLNQYLGGRAIARCKRCDNCVPMPLPPSELPGETQQAILVLRCLAETHGWGRANLVRILCGDRDAPAAAHAWQGYGALGFRSQAAVESLIARLEEGGFVAPRQLDSGGTMLVLTPLGAKALRNPGLLTEALEPPRGGTSKRHQDEETGPIDEALLQQLRAWRTRQARAEGVPPYVVLRDSQLRAIAASRPRSMAELAPVKGVGPARLAKYGEALLAVVRGEPPS